MSWDRRKRAWDLLEQLPLYSSAGKPRGFRRQLKDGLTQGERLIYQRHVDAMNAEGLSWLGRAKLARAAGFTNLGSVTNVHRVLEEVGLLEMQKPESQDTPVTYFVHIPDAPAFIGECRQTADTTLHLGVKADDASLHRGVSEPPSPNAPASTGEWRNPDRSGSEPYVPGAPAPAGSDAQRVLDGFVSLYRTHRNGSTYLVVRKRDIPIARRLLEAFTPERILELATELLTLAPGQDPYIDQTQRRGFDMLSNRATWLDDRLRQRVAQQASRRCARDHQPPCASDGECMRRWYAEIDEQRAIDSKIGKPPIPNFRELATRTA